MKPEPKIHVGILSSATIQIQLNGSFAASNFKNYSGPHEIKLRNGAIQFDGNQYSELSFSPQHIDDNFDIIDVVIGIGFHWERKENQRFKGDLKIIIENNKLTAINRIDVEDYLTSVISSEMSATASNELLKAHAVISRSWLLHPLQDKKLCQSASTIEQTESKFIKWYERDAHSHFDVCADDHCQRYQGITRATTLAVEKAIEATRGEVLMYDNSICDARFSKSCGGISETFENCWAPINHPYLSKVIDNKKVDAEYKLEMTVELNAEKWIRNSPTAFCNTSDKKILAQVLNNYDQETTDFYRWKVVYTQSEIYELIARKSGIDFGEIIDLIPVLRGESGRLIELKIIGTKRTLTVGKELEIRKWLSNSHLYSSAFVVDKINVVNDIPQQFTLTGAGWGHGVGLCQIGAAVMGEKGYNYKEILLHYFSGAKLELIY